MAERYLVAWLGRNRLVIDLRELVDPLLLLRLLLIHIQKAEIDPLGIVIILIDLEHIEIEGDRELSGRPCTDEEVPDYLRRIHLKHIIEIDDIAA